MNNKYVEMDSEWSKFEMMLISRAMLDVVIWVGCTLLVPTFESGSSALSLLILRPIMLSNCMLLPFNKSWLLHRWITLVCLLKDWEYCEKSLLVFLLFLFLLLRASDCNGLSETTTTMPARLRLSQEWFKQREPWKWVKSSVSWCVNLCVSIGNNLYFWWYFFPGKR